MDEINESEVRKRIWARKDAADAKISEAGFAELPDEEQDAWVLSLMLELPFDAAGRALRNAATDAEKTLLWARLDETFTYGKRSALRPVKILLQRYPFLKKPEEGAEG